MRAGMWSALQEFTAKSCSTILARACKNTIRAGNALTVRVTRNSLQNRAPPFLRELVKIQCVRECGPLYRNSLQNRAPPFLRELVKIQFVREMLSRSALQGIH